MDSHRHSVVRRRQRLADLSHLHIVGISNDRANDGRRAHHRAPLSRAAQNFGVSRYTLFRQVVIPAVLPQIIVGMRIGLGVAWLVVVAAEMIALRSGLGYLIIDSRNAGNRYDLVIAGMIIIGLIGLMLDGVMRLLEGLKSVRWRYAH
jgi:NitT/TauT family transport system permease protein